MRCRGTGHTKAGAWRYQSRRVLKKLVILAAVVFTIEKAKSISASVPHASQPVGPIHVQFTIVPTLLVVLFGAVVVGVIGSAILFAMQRSGLHHLSDVNPSARQGSSKMRILWYGCGANSA